MAFKVRKVEYYHTTVHDQPGEAYRILDTFAAQGVNLLAFSAIPMGAAATQLTIFPESSLALESLANRSGMQLMGPHSAFIFTGSDKIGVLVGIHEKLNLANVNVHSSHGVTDGEDGFGYIVHIRDEDFEKAAVALGI